jgi:signal transduction histidine kinase
MNPEWLQRPHPRSIFARLGFLALLALTLLACFGTFREEHFRVEIPEWELQVTLLLAMFGVIAVILSFVTEKSVFAFFYIIQFILFSILVYPMTRSFILVFSVFMLFAVESTLLLRFAFSSLLPMLALLIALLGNGEVAAVLFNPGSRGWANDFLLCLCCLAFSAALWVFNRYFRLFRRELLVSTKLQQDLLALTRANVGFQEYISRVEKKTLEEERNRLTREIHDTMGYTLTTLRMVFEAAKGLQQDEARLFETLDAGIELSKEGMVEVNHALKTMRRIEKDSDKGLDSIIKVARNFELVTKMRVNLEFINTQFNYRQEIVDFIYKMVQESLTNAFRHGNATEVTIVFMEARGTIHVTVRDNGKGAIGMKKDIGILGMEERAGRVNGSLSVSSEPNGFMLRAIVPLP